MLKLCNQYRIFSMSFSPSLNDVLFKLSEILIEITIVPQHSKEIGFKTCHRGLSLLISPPNPQMQIPRKWDFPIY